MKLITLQRIHDELNREIFGSVLTTPRFHAMRNRYIYAYYSSPNGVPTMGWNLNILPRNLICVYATMYHELCHQYEFEILNGKDTWEHGQQFRRVYRNFNKRNFPLFFQRV